MRNRKMMKSAVRVSALGAVLAATAFLPFPNPQAQKRDAPNVTGISSRKTAKGQVITITTDGPVSGTQTWQDPNGKFNLVLPGSGGSQVSNSPSGVAVRRLGNSLGIEVPTRPGANVTVQPRANGVDLIVEGELDSSKPQQQVSSQTASQNEGASSPAPRTPAPGNARSSSMYTQGSPAYFPPVSNAPGQSAAPASNAASSSQANNPANTTPPPADAGVNNQPATAPAPAAAAPPAAAPPAEPPAAEEEGGITSYIFSYTGLGILLGIGLIVALVLRRRKGDGWEHLEEEGAEKSRQQAAPVNVLDEETQRTGERRKRDRRKGSWGGRRQADQPEALTKASTGAQATVEGRETTMETRQNVLVPSALFGAYRVDQEIGKLLLGQPHRIDVLASRAPDDRRAMETSLLKALDSPEIDEDGRRRAREALEDYGYVARQSAALLLSTDAYERASAAHILGEVQSATSLPFLLEALYDPEQIVRTNAVASIGALKLPSAIGALLDMARRYPDMPGHLISRALSDCSVESMFIDGLSSNEFLLTSGDEGMFTGEITALQPATGFEALPEWLEDESLADALERLASADIEARVAAATSLAQYQVQRSVDALTALAGRDPEPGVRAAAVTSLGVIDHESVFAPVLIAFADEAREVRAAAARALSRLNFNRADAYVRLIESADAETLSAVARACVHAGMAKQAIDRLASEDRRQAYEAFTLVSLLARAGENAPLLDAIREHKNEDVRLSAIKALGIFGQHLVLQDLRELAVTDEIPEAVRMALMEVVYKIDQAMNQQEDYAIVPVEPVDC